MNARYEGYLYAWLIVLTLTYVSVSGTGIIVN